MQVHLDCVHCNVRQALEAARLTTADTGIHKKIVFASLEALAKYDSYRTPAEMSRAVHDLVKQYSGNPDPYKKVKEDSIAMARGVYPRLKRLVEGDVDRLLRALEVSAAGNLLDAGVYGDLRTQDMEAVLMEELDRGFALSDLEALRGDLPGARNVLIVADNAGETVLDRILISEIKRACGSGTEPNVFYGVRSVPAINDATVEDAVASGLEHDAIIVDTGCGAPGLVLDDADPEFLEIYREADVVISKGQGNYETLSDSAGRAVYFVLKAKCEVVARDTGASLGDYVLLRR